MPETIGIYQGEIASPFHSTAMKRVLSDLTGLLSGDKVNRLSNGPDYVIRTPLTLEGKTLDITIKVFKRQNWLKDWHDRKHKSKAERSFQAALFLQQKGIGTPAPIAWLDRWENGRLLESYYLCCFEPAVCFRDALVHIYRDLHDNAPLMDLLHIVAPAIRAMHDAGFMHGDMGNQNILLPRSESGEWLQPQFIDLNRGKSFAGPLSDEARAFDLARIALPGAYLKIFKTIYNHHEDFPADLEKLEQKYRTRFWRHRRSGKWRHPIRHWKNRHKKPSHPTYPPGQDIWLWDEKSAQPMITLGRKEKHLYRDWRYMFSMVWQGICALPGIYIRYRQLLTRSYNQPVSLRNKIGVALHPHSNYIETELGLLEELGNPPVLIRFCHHETEADWRRGIQLVEQLHEKGIEVMLAILQDRRALLEPGSWRNFLYLVISRLGNKVSHIEITHASNRLKWGIWNSREYAQLLTPTLELKAQFPHIKISGPACIDFEYLPVVAALGALPKGSKLDALSHLLYVDRRGAPENKQGYFSTLEKSALLKALATWSPHTEDKVIISEVNWPVKHTGIWSPIGCPYETPKWRREQPGETDEDYTNYMLRFLAITLCSGYIDQVFWWRLSAHGYGLVDDQDNFKPRPAFKALAFFLQLLGDATFECKHPLQEDEYLLEFTTPEGTRLLMAWCTQGERDLASLKHCQQVWDAYGNSINTTTLCPSPRYYVSDKK